MNSHDPFDDLEAELTALAPFLDLPTPGPSDVAATVRARLTPTTPNETPTPAPDGTPTSDGTRASDPAHGAPSPAPGRRDGGRRSPAQRGRRRRWTVVAAVVLAVIAVTAATPQGRAAVERILRFAGIELHIQDTTPTPVRTTTPLPGEHPVRREDVQTQVRFKVKTPSKLAPPETITVSDQGRVVSMRWQDGTRLDQFEGAIDPFFFKKLGPPWPDYVQLNGAQAWWIPGEHPLGYIRREDGTQIPLRQAAPTLIWQRDTLTYRLEGAGSKERAVEIAESLR